MSLQQTKAFIIIFVYCFPVVGFLGAINSVDKFLTCVFLVHPMDVIPVKNVLGFNQGFVKVGFDKDNSVSLRTDE